MIGQTQLLSNIKKLQSEGKFPHFVIFVGPKGSGKKTLLSELFNGVYLENSKVESVRKMIDMVYHVENTIFIMPDADSMSLAAKNALLKVVEECPNDNYFIMTLEDKNNTLETIRSRAIIFTMDNYSSQELTDYVMMKYPNETNVDDLVELCDTPGEIDSVVKYGTEKFYSFVRKVIDNIILVSGANAFKIADSISFGNDDKYDIKLFLKVFAVECIRRFKTADNADKIMYASWCNITSRYIDELMITGVNKQALFDAWILEIRESWI